jgi:excisionase family DNA binding protein
VHAVAAYSGYSTQYLRRTLRSGRLDGTRIGQLWLVDKGALDTYIDRAQGSNDQRFGPKDLSIRNAIHDLIYS